MKLRYVFTALWASLLIAACSNEDNDINGRQDTLSAFMPVCFSSGTEAGATTTRATVPYMQKDGRFVCRMYYQGHVEHTLYDSYIDAAWLQVNNAYGNCVYRKPTFVAQTDPTKVDDYGFDKEASIFYWQNRQPHIFIAYTDYNKLTTVDGADGGLLQQPIGDSLVVDLTRKESMLGINDQPDPIMARTVMHPASAMPEANRVKLFFKHCLAQVQVNLKPSVGGGLDKDPNKLHASDIKKVELLGVSEQAYLYAIDVTTEVFDTLYRAPRYKPVRTTDYTPEQLATNPYGTSIEMFAATDDDITNGYISTHNIITFGLVQAIRVTWQEKGDPANGKPGIEHVVTKTIDDKERVLKSGCRHIFNLELRRGTLTILNAEILPWEEHTIYEGIDGTITK